MKNKNKKGEIACRKFDIRAMEKELTVSVPIVDARYDRLLEENGEIKKIQVKYCGTKSNADGSVTVNLRTSRNGKYVSNCYRDNEIDYLFVYIPQIDSLCRFLPKDFDGKSTLTIRFSDAKNNQTSKIRKYSKYVW